MSMVEASAVMERFMEKLRNNEFEKENQPNNGPDINSEFIKKQLDSYSGLIKSGLLEDVLSE